ncbi:MAG: hypothetical protein QM775_30430 [Pirellulales bacterium]
MLRGCIVKLIDKILVSVQEPGLVTALEVREGMMVEADAMIGRVGDSQARMAKLVAEAEYKIAQDKATNDIEVRYAESAAKVAEFEYRAGIQANERAPASISQVKMQELALAYEKAQRQIEQAQHNVEIYKEEAAAARVKVDAAEEDVPPQADHVADCRRSRRGRGSRRRVREAGRFDLPGDSPRSGGRRRVSERGRLRAERRRGQAGACGSGARARTAATVQRQDRVRPSGNRRRGGSFGSRPRSRTSTRTANICCGRGKKWTWRFRFAASSAAPSGATDNLAAPPSPYDRRVTLSPREVANVSLVAAAPSTAADRPAGVRARPDLTYVRRRRTDGADWIVKNPLSLDYYRLLDEEYFLLEQLDGEKTLEEIQAARSSCDSRRKRSTTTELQPASSPRCTATGSSTSAAAGQAGVFARPRLAQGPPDAPRTLRQLDGDAISRV